MSNPSQQTHTIDRGLTTYVQRCMQRCSFTWKENTSSMTWHSISKKYDGYEEKKNSYIVPYPTRFFRFKHPKKKRSLKEDGAEIHQLMEAGGDRTLRTPLQQNGDSSHSCLQESTLETPKNKVFNDPIHGHIELHPLLVKIIDTPQFQRLRYIKQLGGCYFVFSGAAHNRFEHSIGVGHLAGKLLRSLQKRQPELRITDKDVLCVRIAGLCHDLGHGPFSHAFDSLFIPKARPDSDWKHENASLDMFDHMVEENGLKEYFTENGFTDTDLIFIKELIAGPLKEDDEEWPYKGRSKEKCYMYEIVANKKTGIDVDKWDYFARDCHNLGIYNNFDHMRYMKFARVIKVENRLQICIRDKESNNMYDMFHTRNCLHRRAYQHKTSNIIEIMIVEAMLKADSHLFLDGKDGVKVKISEAIDDMVAYTSLNDSIFHRILYSTDPALHEAREILRAVERRELYKCIGQTIMAKNQTFPQELEEKVAMEIASMSEFEEGPEITQSDIIVQFVNFDYGMKEKNPIDQLRFYEKSNPDVAMKFRKNQISNLLPEMFAEQHLRVYCKKKDPASLEKAGRCFVRWCHGKQCTTPKGGNLVPELTPMKQFNEETDKETDHHPSVVGRLSFGACDLPVDSD